MRNLGSLSAHGVFKSGLLHHHRCRSPGRRVRVWAAGFGSSSVSLVRAGTKAIKHCSAPPIYPSNNGSSPESPTPSSRRGLKSGLHRVRLSRLFSHKPKVQGSSLPKVHNPGSSSTHWARLRSPNYQGDHHPFHNYNQGLVCSVAPHPPVLGTACPPTVVGSRFGGGARGAISQQFIPQPPPPTPGVMPIVPYNH